LIQEGIALRLLSDDNKKTYKKMLGSGHHEDRGLTRRGDEVVGGERFILEMPLR